MLSFEPFLTYLRDERNYPEATTIASYRRSLTELSDFLETHVEPGLTAGDVTSDMVRDWIVSLMDRGLKATTVNRMLSATRTYFKFLLRKGEIKSDPLVKVKGPKKKKPLPSFLKESEARSLIEEVDYGDDFEGCRNRTVVTMFYATGMRLSELVGLDDGDVDFSNKTIRVTGKRNKQRLIPFCRELEDVLRTYVERRNREVPCCTDAFFVKMDGERMTDNMVKYWVRKSISQVTTAQHRGPHVLRHSCATAMMNHGADLKAVKELLGHESLATTEIYTHTTFEELKKAYNQAHPRA